MPSALVVPNQEPASDFDHGGPYVEQMLADPRALDNGLTRDNLHLSKVIQTAVVPSNATNADSDNATDAKVLEFLQAARSPNTRHAYQCDLAHFLACGGQLPSTDLVVARYLANHAGNLAIATLRRRGAA